MSETKSTVIPFKRRLGFRHRVKRRIVDGEEQEALPSQVAIMNGPDNIVRIDLESEQAELDFINGCFPVQYRKVNPAEDISAMNEWQVVWRPATEDDHMIERHESQKKFSAQRGKKIVEISPKLLEVAEEIPVKFVGLQPGDALAMCLGGSGDVFAHLASRKLHTMGGEVFRTPPYALANFRGDAEKNDDAATLARFLASQIEGELKDFHPTFLRDRKIIAVRQAYLFRMDALKDRMACEQRRRQRFIGNTLIDEGNFPEGDLEKAYLEFLAGDPILQAIQKQEAEADKALLKAVQNTEVFTEVFSKVQGIGPAIASRFISTIVDIRRFSTAPKLRKFMGVHVNKDGTFPRRRTGTNCSWSPDARQGLYLLADQWVKNKGSDWGGKLLAYKEIFRKRHPVVCIEVSAEKLGIDDQNLAADSLAKLKGRVVVDKKDPTKKKLLVYVPLDAPKVAPKKKYKTKHPLTGEEIEITGPQRYGPGHIHKMAIWRVLSLFVTYLFEEWWKLEKAAKPLQSTDKNTDTPPSSQNNEGGVSPVAQAA